MGLTRTDKFGHGLLTLSSRFVPHPGLTAAVEVHSLMPYFDGLVQERRNSIAYTLELTSFLH